MLRFSAVLVIYLGMENTTQPTLTLTNTTSYCPAFAVWAKDNLLVEDLTLLVKEFRQGEIHGLEYLSSVLKLASQRGGKAFTANVLSSLADALESEIF
jgi:hypothetical protein